MTPDEREALRRLIDARRREIAKPPKGRGDAELAYLRLHPRRVRTHNANGYRNGCRCETCRAAHTEKAARDRASVG